MVAYKRLRISRPSGGSGIAFVSMILYLLYLLLSIRQVNIIFFLCDIPHGRVPATANAVLYGILRYRGLRFAHPRLEYNHR
jgi:hypothetical protein